MILINTLEPAYIFPQHFDTYREAPDNPFWTRGYPDELDYFVAFASVTGPPFGMA